MRCAARMRFAAISDPARALACPVRRSRKGHHRSPLHELPPGRRPADPRRTTCTSISPGLPRQKPARASRAPLAPCVTRRRTTLSARRRLLQQHSRPPALGHGADRDGVAGQVDRARSAARSRIRPATAAAISSFCTSIWQATIWSAGLGTRVKDACRLPGKPADARAIDPGHGSTPERSARRCERKSGPRRDGATANWVGYTGSLQACEVRA